MQGAIPSSWSQSPGLRVLFLGVSNFTGDGLCHAKASAVRPTICSFKLFILSPCPGPKLGCDLNAGTVPSWTVNSNVSSLYIDECQFYGAMPTAKTNQCAP